MKTLITLAILIMFFSFLNVWAGIATSHETIERLEERIANLEVEVQELDIKAQQNLLGDCINENILRDHLESGLIPLTLCAIEREGWYEKLKEEADTSSELERDSLDT